MAAITQKRKLMEARMFAVSIDTLANRLEYVSKDDDYKEGQRIASELKDKVKTILRTLDK